MAVCHCARPASERGWCAAIVSASLSLSGVETHGFDIKTRLGLFRNSSMESASFGSTRGRKKSLTKIEEMAAQEEKMKKLFLDPNVWLI